MGAIYFGPKSLADALSETAGYKAGLTLSVEELCDSLGGTKYPDIIIASETNRVRLRSEEYEAIYWELLAAIGAIEEEYSLSKSAYGLYRKYEGTPQASLHETVFLLFTYVLPRLAAEAKARQSGVIDPTPFLAECEARFGAEGRAMGRELVETVVNDMHMDPYASARFYEWDNPVTLAALFAGGSEKPEIGRFIDQRYIDYLHANPEKLSDMHWRKFEELTAEFFDREGYRIELGPGRNDDGVDVRIWKPDQAPADTPLCLVQCKRQKEKIEKVVVKGLAQDVAFEKANYGVIVTTSELSPGARKTISARGYPLEEVNRDKLREWLTRLRKPGTGIVRV